MMKSCIKTVLFVTIMAISINSQANTSLKSYLVKGAVDYLEAEARNIELNDENNPLDIYCDNKITEEQCLQGLMNLADASEIDGRILTKNRTIEINTENRTSEFFYSPQFNFKSSGQELADFYAKELASVSPALKLEKNISKVSGIKVWGGSASYAEYLKDLQKLETIGAINKVVGEIRILDTFEENVLHPYGAQSYVKGSGPAVVFLKSGFFKDELSEEILNALRGIKTLDK